MLYILALVLQHMQVHALHLEAEVHGLTLRVIRVRLWLHHLLHLILQLDLGEVTGKWLPVRFLLIDLSFSGHLLKDIII